MRFSAFCLFSLWLCLASVSRIALAEHESPAVAPQEEEADEPRLRSQPNAQTLRDIQDTISRTDPQTLDALKEALGEIAQGKSVPGPLGKIALDFLEKIPDADVGVSEVPPEASPEAKKSGESLPAISANSGKVAATAPAGAPTMVRIEAPGPQAAGEGQSSILRAAESAGPGAAVFKAFPYSGAASEEASESNPEEARQRRKARAVSEPGSGGSELPSGQGGVASGGETYSTRTGKSLNGGAVSESTQRLAGTASSLLDQFQRRGPASLGRGLAEPKPGVFERLAATGGFTVERALAKAAASPTYRKFQSATLEAGMSPSESLGAYYSVLALAWLGTIGFLVYCLKFTPLGPQLRLILARSRR